MFLRKNSLLLSIKKGNMKKILLVTLFGFLLLAPSMTPGRTIQQVTEKTSMATEWTYLQGIITKPTLFDNNYVMFHAIIVHYMTHWDGNTRSGYLETGDTILLPRFHYGFLGKHLVFARFNEALYPFPG